MVSWLVYATGIYFIAANIILGSGSVLGRFLPISSIASNEQDDPICLCPLQEERYRNLRLRMEVQFDGSRLDHQDALKQLWRLAYPNREVPPLKSELWKEMGWQGCDPSTDFRGGGYISLENLIFFAKNYPNSFQTLLHKTEGSRADWEYPFAIAGVNISFMLIQMLDLQSVLPSSKAGVRFLELLGEDEKAFDNLYCIAFRMLDAQWLAKRASYMEFNEVLKSTRNQLERELALEDIASVKDLPAYNMLM
ncbi:ELMO/CED-12 family [Musa troglodytarum]|uniref:ELMO/CED-12 family n=1 Tax=Musa troglodytarum TaxID=320322 RepID=A0A9E7L329_9LILI|nr:ELMO/CED-12 family [Musa troglodytarum]URE36098.1 ELMO/CED-12 family [Musa troglodytarum]